MINFSKAEQKIRDIISNSEFFTFEGKKFSPILVSKPVVEGGGGETKTDIYLEAKNLKDKKIHQFKISYKKNNFSFVENKIRKERARMIYGKNWSSIIQKQILSIKKEFSKEPLVYFDTDRRTRKGSIKLGWRYEMEFQSTARRLGVIIQEDIMDQVLQNVNSSKKYSDGIVNGKKISMSGIPNQFLHRDPLEINTIDDVFQNLEPFEKIAEERNVTSAFLAQNYDPYMDKQHGGNRRHLAVYVDWVVVDKKLSAKLHFDKPLETDSNLQLTKLKDSLEKLGINLKENFDIDLLKNKIHESVPVFP